jgi:hypothetical protein
MNLRTTATNTTLALTGAALWAFGAAKLSAGGNFEFRPNPLGVKESPFGQVIALAAQGQIEADWHGVESGLTPAKVCPACGKVHEEGASCAKSGGFLAKVDEAVSERTNPNPASAGHKLYLRRQIEDRLRLAFELDPSNYTNYNAYHFFLTEPELGTRPTLNDKVLQLAKYTGDYCMQEESDPRPSITAASAAGNILLLMFAHKEDYTLDQMRDQLALMDRAIEKNGALANRWIDSGDFQNLSPARQEEMTERITLNNELRASAEATITRLATLSNQVAN